MEREEVIRYLDIPQKESHGISKREERKKRNYRNVQSRGALSQTAVNPNNTAFPPPSLLLFPPSPPTPSIALLVRPSYPSLFQIQVSLLCSIQFPLLFAPDVSLLHLHAQRNTPTMGQSMDMGKFPAERVQCPLTQTPHGRDSISMVGFTGSHSLVYLRDPGCGEPPTLAQSGSSTTWGRQQQ